MQQVLRLLYQHRRWIQPLAMLVGVAALLFALQALWVLSGVSDAQLMLSVLLLLWSLMLYLLCDASAFSPHAPPHASYWQRQVFKVKRVFYKGLMLALLLLLLATFFITYRLVSIALI